MSYKIDEQKDEGNERKEGRGNIRLEMGFNGVSQRYNNPYFYILNFMVVGRGGSRSYVVGTFLKNSAGFLTPPNLTILVKLRQKILLLIYVNYESIFF